MKIIVIIMLLFFQLLVCTACTLLVLSNSNSATADFVGHSSSGRHSGNHRQIGRSGRAGGEGGASSDTAVSGGIDFSGCETDADTGLCCVEKEETITSLEKEPILECTHKNVEQCHYSYVTKFTPTQVYFRISKFFYAQAFVEYF